jgi:nicotinamidase-related amidase
MSGPKLLPPPGYYDPSSVSRLHLERAGLVAEAAQAYRVHHGVCPAHEDRERILAFGVDVQVGFCMPGASLFVPGAVEDTQRALGWLYRNLGRITGLAFSLDTHRVYQIFHPAWWQDEEGRRPAPMTPILADEVRRGRWRATRQPEASLAYCERLEASGRYVLTIWPYHTLLGGLSHALVPAVMEASLFHALARDTPTRFEVKGEHPLTENYSVLSPEVTEVAGESVGAFNEDLLAHLRSFDRIYVFGQAKSHCVLSTLRDLQQRLETSDPAMLRRIHILEDAMSPVPAPPLDPLPPGLDFPRVAEEAMRDFERAGMRVVRTSDPLDP